jgi:hypothetical protein
MNMHLTDSQNSFMTGQQIAGIMHSYGEYPIPPEGTITGNVGRSVKDRKVMQVFKDDSEGKTCNNTL